MRSNVLMMRTAGTRSHSFGPLLCGAAALVACATFGCSSSSSVPRPDPVPSGSGTGVSRSWEQVERRTEWRGTALSLSLASGTNSDGQSEALWVDQEGCLLFRFAATAKDTTETWVVLRLEERSAGGTRTYLITDPPGKPYPGASHGVAYPEDADCPRDAAGVSEQNLSLRDYPIRVRWQLVRSEMPVWSTDAQSVVATGQTVVNNAAGAGEVVLCKDVLDQLLRSGAPQFWFVVRLEPADWTDSTRAGAAPVERHFPKPLPRALILEQSKRIQRLNPAPVKPSLTP